MPVLPVDIVSLVAVIGGLSLVLIPVAGLTLRFALKPVVETIGGFMAAREAKASLELVERRLDLMEQHMELLQSSMERVVTATEFDAQLKSGDADTPKRVQPAKGESA